MKTISVEPVDNAGNFRIQGLSPGRYKFVVVATFDNIQTSWYFGSAAFETATEVELDVGDDLSNIDIDFKTNVFDGVLAGRVIYQGEPVENIMVEIDRQSDGYHLPTIKVSTDADGQFRVDGVVAGSYCIRYTDPNGVYATANNGNAFVNGSCQRISLDAGEERTNLGRHLTLGGTISGQITDVDGPLAAPVEVIAYVYNGSRRGWRSTEISTFTDVDGRYTLAGLLSRTYRLGFKHQTESETKWLYSGLARTVESAQDISVASGEKVADINVAFGLLELLSPRSFLPIMFESN